MFDFKDPNLLIYLFIFVFCILLSLLVVKFTIKSYEFVKDIYGEFR
jgi:hypothetical protein